MIFSLPLRTCGDSVMRYTSNNYLEIRKFLRVILKLSCQKGNRSFPSSPQSLFQSESKCETFVMIISSNFNMNEN